MVFAYINNLQLFDKVRNIVAQPKEVLFVLIVCNFASYLQLFALILDRAPTVDGRRYSSVMPLKNTGFT